MCGGVRDFPGHYIKVSDQVPERHSAGKHKNIASESESGVSFNVTFAGDAVCKQSCIVYLQKPKFHHYDCRTAAADTDAVNET